MEVEGSGGMSGYLRGEAGESGFQGHLWLYIKSKGSLSHMRTPHTKEKEPGQWE